MPTIVNDCWNDIRSLDLIPRLNSSITSLARWGQQFDHKFKSIIDQFKVYISRLRGDSNLATVHQYNWTRNQLSNLLTQEEVYWKQRAKIFWLQERDSNTHFFHGSTSTRRRVSHIHKLQDDSSI